MQETFYWTESSKHRNKLSHTYEPVQPYLFLSFIEYSNASIVLDIGANVGLYTVLSSASPSVERVIAFEPEEHAYNELKENIFMNGLSAFVEPLFKLVSDVNQKQRFGVHSALSGINGVLNSSIHDKALFQEIRKIDSITLDSYLSYKDTVLALKIDVEGHELQVLRGAVKLLKQNPTLIQIEHYVGNEIDELLSSMGYNKIHSAGHDYYYSNISNFSYAGFVNRAISHAHALLIDYSTGAFKSDKVLSQALTLDFAIKGNKLNASARVTSNIFFDGQLEYAFYLIKDDEKVETRWYSEEKSCEFDLPEDFKGYSLKGFVREVKNPKKMTTREISLNQKGVINGARSSSADSYNAPIKCVQANNPTVNCHYELDYHQFLTHPFLKETNNIVLLGANHLESETVSLFLTRFKKVVSISYQNIEQRNQLHLTSAYEHISTSSQVELFDAIKKFKSKGKGSACFVILDDLFNNLPLSEALIKNLTECSIKTDVFACQALTNRSYRKLLLRYTHQLLFIFPKSSIQKTEGYPDENTLNEVPDNQRLRKKLDFRI